MAIESSEQKEFIKWFKASYPGHEKAIRVSMLGLNLGGGKKAAILINHIKGQGGVMGESDIAILAARNGYGSLLIEHKGEGQPHVLSDKQLDYMSYHNANGNLAVSTRGIEALKAAVKAYMG